MLLGRGVRNKNIKWYNGTLVHYRAAGGLSEEGRNKAQSTMLRLEGSKNSSLWQRAVTSSGMSRMGRRRVKVFVILTFQTILKQIGKRLAGMEYFSYLCIRNQI